MPSVGRNDTVLIVGLAVSLAVAFSGSVSDFLDYVRGIEQLHDLHLLPALLILATVFSLHEFHKRQEFHDRTEAAAKAAAAATDRASELSRLVAFGHALARSMDGEAGQSIREVVAAHIPLMVPGRGAWVMTRTRGGQWDSLVVIGEASAADRQCAAQQALGEVESVVVGTEPGAICFPMFVAGSPEGVLGVAPEPPLTGHQRSVLSAAAALLAVSLKNLQLFSEVRENSIRDRLTGCFNRAHAIEVLDVEIRRARRTRLPLSLMMFDLDNFKTINDRYGHLCGDAVLAAVGTTVRTELRGSDVRSRYGGDEFMIILPDTPLEGATLVSENLRRQLESQVITWNDDQVRFTASFGVTTVDANDLNPMTAIARADDALRRAKGLGRNGVQLKAQTPALALDA